MADAPSPEVQSPPDEVTLKAGIAAGINESHFSPPIEVTDLFRSPSNYVEPWLICIRSASSDEARRLTSSVFYGTNPNNGLPRQYVKSRYSIYPDNCTSQAYHPFTATAAPAAPAPSPTPEPKKHHRHQQ